MGFSFSIIFQLTFPGQNKDKQQTAAAIPGVAAPHTPPGSSAATAVPKRLLSKTKRALSEADLPQASAEKPFSPSKSQVSTAQATDGDQGTQNPPPKSRIGTFHHLPHYMKLYEIIKGAFANNQVRVSRNGLIETLPQLLCYYVWLTPKGGF